MHFIKTLLASKYFFQSCWPQLLCIASIVAIEFSNALDLELDHDLGLYEPTRNEILAEITAEDSAEDSLEDSDAMYLAEVGKHRGGKSNKSHSHKSHSHKSHSSKSSGSSSEAIELPALCVNPDTVTVSGFSTGAGFAHKLHIAHSGTIKGAGIMHGLPYIPYNLGPFDTSTPAWSTSTLLSAAAVS